MKRLWLLLLLTGTAAGAWGRPVYTVVRTAVPIQVDGRWDEVWSRAESVGPFRDNLEGTASPLVTDARILYDDRFLYFAFRIVDDNIWATMTQRDQHLWTEEVVEVFLYADPQYPSYIELEVNPLNAMLDIYLVDVRKPIPYESWNSRDLQWGVQVDGTVDGRGGDREWTCEIALPLQDVVPAPHIPPRDGDRWRLNLYRVESRPEKAGLAWSPTGVRDFHRPQEFGEIVFSSREIR